MSQSLTRLSDSDEATNQWHNYELPKVVESARQAYLGSYQASAVVAGLFIATEAQLLAMIHSNDSAEPRSLYKLLLASTYGSLIFNIGAIISSLMLIDRFGALPYHNRRRGAIRPSVDDRRKPVLILLRENFRLPSSVTWLFAHWLFCVTAGSFCTLLQLTLNAWLYEPRAIFIIASIASGIAGMPLLLLFFEPPTTEAEMVASLDSKEIV